MASLKSIISKLCVCKQYFLFLAPLYRSGKLVRDVGLKRLPRSFKTKKLEDASPLTDPCYIPYSWCFLEIFFQRILQYRKLLPAYIEMVSR